MKRRILTFLIIVSFCLLFEIFLVSSVDAVDIFGCQTISASGTYDLKNNITDIPETCFDIDADNVTLDLGGYSITGTGSGVGVHVHRQNNSRIRNGEIYNFNSGISITYNSGHAISNITSSDNGAIGIYFSSVSNSTLINTITNSNGDTSMSYARAGIYITGSRNITITNAESNNNDDTGIGVHNMGTLGIRIIDSTANSNSIGVSISAPGTLLDNVTANDNSTGILIYERGLIMRNSTMNGNGLANFAIGTFDISNITSHVIEQSNIVDYAYKIYYREGLSDYTFDNISVPDAGMIVCVSCNNIEIKDLNLAHRNSHGVLFVNTDNSRVNNITASGNRSGMELYQSHSNTVNGFTADNTRSRGILIKESNNNNLSNVQTNNNSDEGIRISESSGNNLSNIIANGNDDGIYLRNSSNNTISNATGNYNDRGLYFLISPNNSISDSTFCPNSDADIYCHIVDNPQTLFSNNNCQTVNICSAICIPCFATPTVITDMASDILATSATLNGNITDTGGDIIKRKGFEWGTSPGNYTSNYTMPGSFGTGTFSRNITGLSLSTTYYYRARAENSAGWGYGEEKSFTITNPCQNHNVWDWAWSDNIGWISFSCRNEGTGVDYGVNANIITGELSGYAWSENIGWISFEAASVSGCPNTAFIPNPKAEPCQAYIDFSDSNIYGWARACSVFDDGCSGDVTSLNLGGWDGWIKLDGSDPFYGSYLDDSLNPPNPSEFREWAWGGNVVVGWVSLNSSNCDPDGDGLSNGVGNCPPAGTIMSSYWVRTDLNTNSSPVASILCTNPVGGDCRAYIGGVGGVLGITNTSADPDGNDDITLCQWYRDDLESALVEYEPYGAPCADLCHITFVISPRGQWDVKLYVEDSKGASSESGVITATMLRDIVASFECSLDGTDWRSCSKIMAVEGDMLYLRDTSFASEYPFGANRAINNWSWTVDGNNVGNSSTVDEHPIQIPQAIIELTVRDNNNRWNTKQEQLGGIMPLPTWKEIAPF